MWVVALYLFELLLKHPNQHNYPNINSHSSCYLKSNLFFFILSFDTFDISRLKKKKNGPVNFYLISKSFSRSNEKFKIERTGSTRSGAKRLARLLPFNQSNIRF